MANSNLFAGFLSFPAGLLFDRKNFSRFIFEFNVKNPKKFFNDMRQDNSYLISNIYQQNI